MHRDAGEWRHGEGISSPALSKEGQGERRCLFIIGVGAGKFWWCEGFCPNLPKLARKVFCATFAYKFSPTKIMKTTFWCNLQKKVFTCFYTKLGRHFLKTSNVWRYFYQDFQGFCPYFQQIKTFRGAFATPALHLQHYCFSQQCHRPFNGLSRSTWNNFIAAIRAPR